MEVSLNGYRMPLFLDKKFLDKMPQGFTNLSLTHGNEDNIIGPGIEVKRAVYAWAQSSCVSLVSKLTKPKGDPFV